jgi:aspartate/methionine/tyrosine aminotransferase
VPGDDTPFSPLVDQRALEVFRRAADPRDSFELRDLWLGRVEHELGAKALRPDLADRWRAARVRRSVTAEEVLSSRATVRFVKELFNFYFRDDLYGDLRSDGAIILSSGSVDEEQWGLPETLKECIRFALDRDLYGYSDSRGRVPAREAIAAYESARIEGTDYTVDNVAMTMGGTSAVSMLADLILHNAPRTGAPALCGIPNYPPLVESVARRREVALVPLPSTAGSTSLAPLIAALRPDTPLVLIQTVANPTGAAVPEEELRRLIEAASPSTMILLDECHEWLGPLAPCSAARASANVIRISSLSKTWSAPGMKIGWILADARFVAEYYEHASTTFGGPPSFFYTLAEVLARMDRWIATGVQTPGSAEAGEFEAAYEVDLPRLRTAYASYRSERQRREQGLTALREATVVRLAEVSSSVLRPRYSINAALRFAEWEDSYLCFRQLFAETGVSVFPGVLTFCLSGGIVRVTTARRWEELSTAIDRIGARFAATGGLSCPG